MNLLSHIYLSGESSGILAGNLMGDFIKGIQYQSYPKEIQRGILLHRRIDYFTDTHDVVRRSKSYLIHRYDKYSGVVVDIFYDHFLAKEWSHFCKTPLDIFVKETEDRLDPYWDIFPEAVNNFLKRFFDRGWLNTYKTVEGIERVLLGMSKNTSLPAKTPHAIEIFNDKYANFRKDFYEFFPKIMKYVSTNYNITFCG